MRRVSSIGAHAFLTCKSLTSVIFQGHLSSIGDCAFEDCSSLETIAIPDSVTAIGSCAFCHCSSLVSVSLPEKLTSIEDHTFYRCTSLTSINIPSGVTSIGPSAFNGCTGMTSIYCSCTTPPDVCDDAFEEVAVGNVLLCVPDRSLAQYKSHDVWKRFWIETPTGTVSIDESLGDNTVICDLSGRPTRSLQGGIVIVGGKNRKETKRKVWMR